MNIFKKIIFNRKIIALLKALATNHHISETCTMLALIIFFYSANVLDGAAFSNEENLTSMQMEEEQPIESVFNKEEMVELLSYSMELLAESEASKPSTTQDKIDSILEKYELTEEQFRVIVAVTIAEAKAHSYEDAYYVINTIYNRTISAGPWADGIQNGHNLYYQVIRSTQFQVYGDGTYKKYLNIDLTELTLETIGARAVIDFLYNQAVVHDYLSFVGNGFGSSFSDQMVPDGNMYSNNIKTENRIEMEGETRITKEDVQARETELLEIIERETNRRDRIEIPIYEDGIVQVYDVIEPDNRRYNLVVPKAEKAIIEMTDEIVNYINFIAFKYNAIITETVSTGITRTLNKMI